MPWKPSDAYKFNKSATTVKKQDLWAQVANRVLFLTGDEGRAVREANSAVKHLGDKK